MLIGFVLLYLALTVTIGVWAARRVHTSKDFLLAGRSLPLYMSVTTVFAMPNTSPPLIDDNTFREAAAQVSWWRTAWTESAGSDTLAMTCSSDPPPFNVDRSAV